MKFDKIDQILGGRDLEISDGRKVTITIGIPQKHGDDFLCPYKIVGIGEERVQHAIGIDALQALQLTLKKIGADLYTSDEARAGMLSWEGELVKGDLGFPVPDVIKDFLP